MNLEPGANPYGVFNTVDVVTGDLRLKGEKVQNFVLQFRNESGTINHRIAAGGTAQSSTNSQYVDKVSGATSTLTPTTFLGDTVGFAAGAGLWDADRSLAVLDVADQTGSGFFAFAIIEFYDGGVDFPTAIPAWLNRFVNGSTRFRLELQFKRQADGGPFTINTTTIPSGSMLTVRVVAFLK